jgi:outer membrane protein
MKQTKFILAATIGLLAARLAPAGDRLTLEESRRLALANNVGIKNSRMETEAARDAKKAAFTRYFPSLSAGAASFKADQPLMEFTPAMGLFGKGSFGMLNLVQPVYAGGRIANGNRLAALGVEVGGCRERMVRNEVILSTEEQYWRVVALDGKLKTAASYEEFLNRLLVRVEAAYQAGLATKNDFLKVRLKLSGLQVDKSKLQNGRNVSAMAFCQYIGIPYDPQLELEEAPPLDGPPDSFKVDHRAALPLRPEYELSEAAVRSESLQSRLKLGEFLPQAGIGLAGIYMKSDDAKGKTNGMIYGTISIPLSGWWEAAHAMNERKARERIARNNLKDRSEALLIQMEKAWQELNDAAKLVRLAQESLAQAEENLKVNEDSYENGMSDVSDLLEAQALRQQTLDQVTDAAVDYRLTLVGYLQVTGR